MSKRDRDDFSENVKKMLKVYANGCCSKCHIKTDKINFQSNKVENIGEAAHITSAAKDGPRYDPSLTEEKRGSFENGIWLCRNCHKQIDDAPEYYTTDLLKKMKEEAACDTLPNQITEEKSNPQVYLAIGLKLFKKLYFHQKSLHDIIKKIKEKVDDNWDFCRNCDTFETNYLAYIELSVPFEPISDLEKNKNDIWGENIIQLYKTMRKYEDFIDESNVEEEDDFLKEEKDYLQIVGSCPYNTEEKFEFFKRIKERFDDLDGINTKLLERYKNQTSLYKEAIYDFENDKKAEA